MLGADCQLGVLVNFGVPAVVKCWMKAADGLLCGKSRFLKDEKEVQQTQAYCPSFTFQSMVRYEFMTPYRDGTTQVVIELGSP